VREGHPGFLELFIALFLWFLPDIVRHAEQLNTALIIACCVALPLCYEKQ